MSTQGPPGYQILFRLGGGGFGEVFLAIQESSGQKVAIKQALKTVGDVGLGRLRNEARALAAIRSPGLPKIYELVEDDQSLFLVMEFIEGRELGEVIEGCLSAEARMDVLRAALPGVFDGLEALHGAGLVHRDIKPENILVRDDGTGVLVDLGLVKGQDIQTMTATGMVVGTPAYMAPEQIAGSKDFGPATDVYQVALLIVRMVSSDPIPTGEGAIEEAIRRSTGQGLRVLLEGLPTGLIRRVESLLDPRPEERGSLASARQILQLLAEMPPEGGRTLAHQPCPEPPREVHPTIEKAAWRAHSFPKHSLPSLFAASVCGALLGAFVLLAVEKSNPVSGEARSIPVQFDLDANRRMRVGSRRAETELERGLFVRAIEPAGRYQLGQVLESAPFGLFGGDSAEPVAEFVAESGGARFRLHSTDSWKKTAADFVRLFLDADPQGWERRLYSAPELPSLEAYMRQVVDHQSRRELEGHLSLIQAFLKMDQGESPQSKQLIRALLPMVVAEVQHKGAKTPLAPLARLAIAPAVEVCIGPCSQKPVAFGEGVKYYGHLNADLPKEPSLFDRNPSEIPTGARYEEGALMIPVPRPDVESLVAAEIGLLQQKGGGGRRLKVWLTSDDFIVLPSTEERNWVFSTIPVSWLEDWKSAGGSEVWLRVENLNLDGRPSTQRVNVVAVRFHTWSS